MKAEVLSDVLQAVRLTGAVYFDNELSSPWVTAIPPSREIARRVMPGAERVIEYHLFAEGEGWARSVGQESIRMREGDIIGLDLGAIVDGYYADAAVTLPVGEVTEEVRRLLDVTRESLELAIAQCRPGQRLGDVSAAVQRHVEAAGFGIVRAFVGHGIGRALHEDPQVPNFGEPGRGPLLRAGMVLALEPMVTMGHWEVRVLEDRWTAVTADGSLAAHFEHTVAVTERGPDVLTADAREAA